MRRHIKVKARLSGDGATVLLDVLVNKSPTMRIFKHSVIINTMGPFPPQSKLQINPAGGLMRVLVEGPPTSLEIRLHPYKNFVWGGKASDSFYPSRVRGDAWNLCTKLVSDGVYLNTGIPIPINLWPHVKATIEAYNKEYAE
jgi:hypothetical protein